MADASDTPAVDIGEAIQRGVALLAQQSVATPTFTMTSVADLYREGVRATKSRAPAARVLEAWADAATALPAPLPMTIERAELMPKVLLRHAWRYCAQGACDRCQEGRVAKHNRDIVGARKSALIALHGPCKATEFVASVCRQHEYAPLMALMRVAHFNGMPAVHAVSRFLHQLAERQK